MNFEDVNDIDAFIADQITTLDKSAPISSKINIANHNESANASQYRSTDDKRYHAQVMLSFHRRMLLRQLRQSYGQNVDGHCQLARCYLPQRQITTGTVSTISSKRVRLVFPNSGKTTVKKRPATMSEAQRWWRMNHNRRNRQLRTMKKCYASKTCSVC